MTVPSVFLYLLSMQRPHTSRGDGFPAMIRHGQSSPTHRILAQASPTQQLLAFPKIVIITDVSQSRECSEPVVASCGSGNASEVRSQPVS